MYKTLFPGCTGLAIPRFGGNELDISDYHILTVYVDKEHMIPHGNPCTFSHINRSTTGGRARYDLLHFLTIVNSLVMDEKRRGTTEVMIETVGKHGSDLRVVQDDLTMRHVAGLRVRLAFRFDEDRDDEKQQSGAGEAADGDDQSVGAGGMSDGEELTASALPVRNPKLLSRMTDAGALALGTLLQQFFLKMEVCLEEEHTTRHFTVTETRDVIRRHGKPRITPKERQYLLGVAGPITTPLQLLACLREYTARPDLRVADFNVDRPDAMGRAVADALSLQYASTTRMHALQGPAQQMLKAFGEKNLVFAILPREFLPSNFDGFLWPALTQVTASPEHVRAHLRSVLNQPLEAMFHRVESWLSEGKTARNPDAPAIQSALEAFDLDPTEVAYIFQRRTLGDQASYFDDTEHTGARDHDRAYFRELQERARDGDGEAADLIERFERRQLLRKLHMVVELLRSTFDAFVDNSQGQNHLDATSMDMFNQAMKEKRSIEDGMRKRLLHKLASVDQRREPERATKIRDEVEQEYYQQLSALSLSLLRRGALHFRYANNMPDAQRSLLDFEDHLEPPRGVTNRMCIPYEPGTTNLPPFSEMISNMLLQLETAGESLSHRNMMRMFLQALTVGEQGVGPMNPLLKPHNNNHGPAGTGKTVLLMGLQMYLPEGMTMPMEGMSEKAMLPSDVGGGLSGNLHYKIIIGDDLDKAKITGGGWQQPSSRRAENGNNGPTLTEQGEVRSTAGDRYTSGGTSSNPFTATIQRAVTGKHRLESNRLAKMRRKDGTEYMGNMRTVIPSGFLMAWSNNWAIEKHLPLGQRFLQFQLHARERPGNDPGSKPGRTDDSRGAMLQAQEKIKRWLGRTMRLVVEIGKHIKDGHMHAIRCDHIRQLLNKIFEKAGLLLDDETMSINRLKEQIMCQAHALCMAAAITIVFDNKLTCRIADQPYCADHLRLVEAYLVMNLEHLVMAVSMYAEVLTHPLMPAVVRTLKETFTWKPVLYGETDVDPDRLHTHMDYDPNDGYATDVAPVRVLATLLSRAMRKEHKDVTVDSVEAALTRLCQLRRRLKRLGKNSETEQRLVPSVVASLTLMKEKGQDGKEYTTGDVHVHVCKDLFDIKRSPIESAVEEVVGEAIDKDTEFLWFTNSINLPFMFSTKMIKKLDAKVTLAQPNYQPPAQINFANRLLPDETYASRFSIYRDVAYTKDLMTMQHIQHNSDIGLTKEEEKQLPGLWPGEYDKLRRAMPNYHELQRYPEVLLRSPNEEVRKNVKRLLDKLEKERKSQDNRDTGTEAFESREMESDPPDPLVVDGITDVRDVSTLLRQQPKLLDAFPNLLPFRAAGAGGGAQQDEDGDDELLPPVATVTRMLAAVAARPSVARAQRTECIGGAAASAAQDERDEQLRQAKRQKAEAVARAQDDDSGDDSMSSGRRAVSTPRRGRRRTREYGPMTDDVKVSPAAVRGSQLSMRATPKSAMRQLASSQPNNPLWTAAAMFSSVPSPPLRGTPVPSPRGRAAAAGAAAR